MAQKKNNFSKKSSFANHIKDYTISFEPLDDPVYDVLPEDILDELATILTQIKTSSIQARNSIPRLEKLIALYPEQPKIANFLAMAYLKIKHPKTAELVYESYLKYPQYLFARMNYAELCLERDDLAEIETIFAEGLHLTLLYPERDCFHFSEFIGFNWLIFRYFMRSERYPAAEIILGELEQAAPKHEYTLKAQQAFDHIQALAVFRKLSQNLAKGNKSNKPFSFKA